MGSFPSFTFIRKLKEALSQNEETIFRYAPHKNTILDMIYNQLQVSNEADKDDLYQWIRTINQSSGDSLIKWEGAINMVDM